MYILVFAFAAGCNEDHPDVTCDNCNVNDNQNDNVPASSDEVKVSGPAKIAGISREPGAGNNDFFSGNGREYTVPVSDSPAVILVTADDTLRVRSGRSFEVWVPSSATNLETWIRAHMAGPNWYDPNLFPQNTEEVWELEYFASAFLCFKGLAYLAPHECPNAPYNGLFVKAYVGSSYDHSYPNSVQLGLVFLQ